MTNKVETEVMCCFCGNSGQKGKMISLIVNMDKSDEQQKKYWESDISFLS